MTQPFLALITPLSDARPDNSLPVTQPPSGAHPSHPIYIPGLGIWGGPWQPPYPSQGPGFPSQLPMPGGPPLGTWGGVGQPYPDQGLPAGGPVRPDNSLPGSGLGTWGPNDPRPTPPIYVPPQAPITDPDDPQKAYLVAYMPAYGGGYERITFSVEIPPPTTPTEPSPKPSQG